MGSTATATLSVLRDIDVVTSKGRKGSYNRSVSGTATQVSIQGLNNLTLGRTWICLKQTVHRRDHSAGTEAALRPIVVCQTLLHRMQVTWRTNAFHSGDFLTVTTNDGMNTAVERHRNLFVSRRVSKGTPLPYTHRIQLDHSSS